MPDPSIKLPVDTGEKTISGRTIWNDPETGEDYSERSTTFEIDGKHYTMPTVSKDGRQHSEVQIRDYVKENGPIDYLTGEELPIFESQDDAIDYAIQRSSTRKQTDMAKGGAIPMNNQMQQFAEGGLEDEGGEIDEVSGNKVPIGGTKEGVRDDIPANVSEGEFIFPADVVRFVGLDKLMSIRQDAKMGLQKMEAMGQMGNSDEATMDDDMPFEMADLVVIGGQGEPMEFANGGFIPVKDYTEVQDMIADKSQKGAGYAPGGMVQSYTDYQGQPLVNPPVNLTGDPYIDINDVRDAAIIDPDLGKGNNVTSGTTEELETAYVPTSTGTEEIDYTAYVGSVKTIKKEYRNAAGESVVITFINGVPTLPIPEGYTLYTPEEGDTVSPAGNVVSVTSGNFYTDIIQSEDGSEVNTTLNSKPIDYAKMSDKDFAAQMKRESGGLYQFGRIIGFTIGSMVPFGATVLGGSMRSHARKGEARLNRMIDGASGKYKAELIAIRDGWLKSNGLKPTADSNALVSALDSLLTGDGYTKAQIDAGIDAATSPNISDDKQASINNILYSQVDIEPGKTVPFADQPESYSRARATEIQTKEDAFERGDITREQADEDIQRIQQTYNVLPGRTRVVGRSAERNPRPSIASSALEGDPKYLGDNDLQGTQSLYDNARERKSVYDPLRIRDDQNAYGRLVYNANLKNEMKTVGDPLPSGKIKTADDAGRIASEKMMEVTNEQYQRQQDPGSSGLEVLSKSNFDRFAKGEPIFTGNSVFAAPAAKAREIQKQADDYYQTGAGMDGYSISQPLEDRQIRSEEGYGRGRLIPQPLEEQGATTNRREEGYGRGRSIPQGLDQEYFNKLEADNADSFESIGAAAPLAPDGKAYIPAVASAEEQAKRLKKYNNDQTLLAEKAAVNARQNNSFQNAANELFKNDNKEYRGGVLYSTAGKNKDERINTAYMDTANAFSTGDGLKYVDGILRDKDGEGNPVNNAFQNLANEFSTGDGRSYIGGELIDDKTKRAYIPKKDRSPNTLGRSKRTKKDVNDYVAMSQGALSFGRSPAQIKSDIAQTAAITAADQARSNAKDNPSMYMTDAERKADQFATYGRYDEAGNPYTGRAEGGLIQKPAKIKKPTTPKTKKRGLAARK